jgi:hypothetical protein
MGEGRAFTASTSGQLPNRPELAAWLIAAPRAVWVRRADCGRTELIVSLGRRGEASKPAGRLLIVEF